MTQPSLCSAGEHPNKFCCYIRQSNTAATGFFARVREFHFVLTTHTMLPDAASCEHASVIFRYNLPDAVHTTLDPKLLFLTSPAAELDFTLVALSLDSLNQLPMQSILPFAYDLSHHVTRDKVARYTACQQYEFRLHCDLHVSAGYVLSLYGGWIADAALQCSSGGGLMVGGEEHKVLGFHREWNASRGWNEGTLIADILPVIEAHFAALRQRAPRTPWFALTHLLSR